MRYFLTLIAIIILNSCAKSGLEEFPPEDTLDKATLVAPAKDAVCISGSTISSTTSSVTFDWDEVSGATKFELHLKNLLTGTTSSHNTEKSELQVDLNKSTPYSWFVTSFASGSSATTNSEVWKFYNAGEGVENFAPFPAENIFPTENAAIDYSSDYITLKWSSADTDNDMDNFDVYFGETSSLLKVGNTQPEINEFKVTVYKGKSYTWQIITNDKMGNSSSSNLFYFSIH